MPRYLVTGGAGFIGAHLIRLLLRDKAAMVLNLDKLTYAGNLASLDDVADSPRYEFLRADIADDLAVSRAFATFQPDTVFNLAAESHVDRSIAQADEFVRTNVLGTFNMLEAARAYWTALSEKRQKPFRFLHVSTDEVYGSLGSDNHFSETSSYRPRNPYSATKAGADHLVRAWFTTYGFPTIITNCSNNYGPYQYPEKLIPLTVLRLLRGEKAQIHGDGLQIRDWLHVTDHVVGLQRVAQVGIVGETYMIGGENQYTVREVVLRICRLLDELRPLPNDSYGNRVETCPERPGNDRRYAVDASRVRQLGWQRTLEFDMGLRETVRWYLENKTRWDS